MPFHRKARGVKPVGPLPAPAPTARASPGVGALMLARELPWPGCGLGLGTRVKLRPFQRNTKVLAAGDPGPAPTAQASLADSALTPLSSLCPATGMGTCCQAAPFQCSTKELKLGWVPTAQASEGESALTPRRFAERFVTGLLPADAIGAAPMAPAMTTAIELSNMVRKCILSFLRCVRHLPPQSNTAQD